MELPSQGDVLFFQRPHFYPRFGDQRHGGVESAKSSDRKIGMNQLLQDLRRSAKRSMPLVGLSEKAPGDSLKLVRASYRVHEHVAIDKNQEKGAPCLRDAAIVPLCSSQSGSILDPRERRTLERSLGDQTGIRKVRFAVVHRAFGVRPFSTRRSGSCPRVWPDAQTGRGPRRGSIAALVPF